MTGASPQATTSSHRSDQLRELSTLRSEPAREPSDDALLFADVTHVLTRRWTYDQRMRGLLDALVAFGSW